MKKKCFLIIALFSFYFLFTGLDDEEILNYIPVGHFSEFSPDDKLPKKWKQYAFEDIPEKTKYALVEDKERKVTVLKAESNQGALALIHKVNIDPKKFPILTWQWKIDDIIRWSNLYTKEGDDHPVRLYVFFENKKRKKGVLGKLFHETERRVLNYVWAQRAPFETIAPSPYSKEFMKLVLQSGDEFTGEWRAEYRNVYKDYKKVFFDEPERIVAVMLMTDSDNTKEKATGYYGDISFHPDDKSGGKILLNPILSNAELVYHRNKHIYVADRNGKNEVQIAFDPAQFQYEHVAVSYNRRYIVASERLPNPSNEIGGRSRLWLFDLRKKIRKQLVPEFLTAGNGGVDWDPEGLIYFIGKEKNIVPKPIKPKEFIINAGQLDVYRIKPNGARLERLTKTPDFQESDLSVSHDGAFIAYSGVSFPSGDYQIWSVNSDGTNPTFVYRREEEGIDSLHGPEHSPDNEKIVFGMINSDVPPNFPEEPSANTASDIWVIDIKSAEKKRLTKPGPISKFPDWREDGRIVYLKISEGEQYANCAVVLANGENQGGMHIYPVANAVKWIPPLEKIE